LAGPTQPISGLAIPVAYPDKRKGGRYAPRSLEP